MRPFPRLPILLVPLALAACGHSPATTFLTIDPAPPTPTHAAAYAGAPLRVPYLHVPVTLDRPEFAHEVAGTIAVSDFNRWAAPLGLLARNTLIQDLQARLPAGSVLPPDAAATVPELLVEATVTRFHVEGGEAMMDVSYRLVRPGTAHATVAPPAVPELVSLHTPVAADTPAAQAAAWSTMLGELADRIAGELAVR